MDTSQVLLSRDPPACSCPATGLSACLVLMGCKEKQGRVELNWKERKRLMMGWTSSLAKLLATKVPGQRVAGSQDCFCWQRWFIVDLSDAEVVQGDMGER